MLVKTPSHFLLALPLETSENIIYYTTINENCIHYSFVIINITHTQILLTSSISLHVKLHIFQNTIYWN